MNNVKSTFFQIIKRKESFLFLILLISGIGLFGWLSGKMGLASFSLKYLPIPHSSAVVFIALSILFFININFEKSQLIKSLVTLSAIIIAFYCSLIFLDFLFNFTWDVENIFIKNPERFGDILKGRMSPITSLMFIFICTSFLGIRQNNFNIIKYIGGSFSLLAFFASSVLLIGYLYKAPLLYGSKTIPVSLPSAICFLLFSITLLRESELKFWTFNLIEDNKVVLQLLKSFLPIVVFMVILQGFLDTVFSFKDINPPLTTALILVTIVVITIFLIFRVSTIFGVQLQRAERALRENESSLRDAQEIAKMGSWELDMVTQKTNWSDNYFAIFGFKSTEVESSFELIRNRIHPDDVLSLDENYAIIMKDKTPSSIELRLIQPDGTFKWIQNNMSPVIEDNILVKLKGVIIDITERKLAELALKENEQNLKERIKELIGIYSLGLLTEKFVKQEDIYNEFVNNVVPASMQFPEKVFVSLKIESKKYCNIENFKLLKNRKYLSAPINIFGKQEGELIVAYIEDLPFIDYFEQKLIENYVNRISIFTERIKTQQILKENETKLHQLNIDKDRFIAILGHDLRSPFTTLLGLSEVLTEDIRKLNIDEIENHANNINKSARNTFNLLEDILLWARTQQGKIPFKPQILSFKDICMNILEILKPNADAKNIAINYIATIILPKIRTTG